jgi:protein required for attachment to host cells
MYPAAGQTKGTLVMELKTTPKRVSKNYRMSPESIRLIAAIAHRKKTTVSDVLDNLVLIAAPKVLDGMEKSTERRRGNDNG